MSNLRGNHRLDDAIFRRIVDAAPDGVVIVADDRIVYVNAQLEQTFGYEPDELWGQPVDRLLPDRLRSTHTGHRARYQQAPRPRPMGAGAQFMGCRKDGTEIPVEISLSSIQHSEGQLVIAVVRDQRERQQAEQRFGEVRQLSEFLNVLIENMPAMVFVKDARDLHFQLLNRSGEQLLGISRSAIIGKTDHALFPEAQARFFAVKDRETLEGRRLVVIPEEPIDTPAGRRWVYTQKLAILDHAGTPIHLLGISVDITERREAEEALRQARDHLEFRVQERTALLFRQIEEREKAEEALRQTEERFRQAQKMDAVGRLAGGIVHEFNNLLSVVVGYNEIAIADLAAESPLREVLEEVRKAAERAAQLTRQLLAFSRQQVLQPQVVCLRVMLRGMERMFARLVGEDIAVVVEGTSESGCWVDPGQIEQVVMNLVANARDAMPDGGRLTLEISDVDLDPPAPSAHPGAGVGRQVRLTVTDTGTGMDDATRSRIFEPFYTTKPVGKGTGLGLSMVHGIVQQSGGSIWVDSEPGVGSTFTVYLPRVEGAAAPARAPRVASPWAGSETVLLVEDEDQVRVVTRTILRRHGYSVLEARSAEEAVSLSEAHPGAIDLLFTDVVMPGMNGPALARRLTGPRPGMKVLFMSGYTEGSMGRHDVLVPGVAFLQKPLTPESVARKVRAVLDAPPGGDSIGAARNPSHG